MNSLKFCALCYLFTYVYANKLRDAISNDDAHSVKDAIDRGADLNEVGPGGQTPLMFAVLSGKTNAVKILLEGGADTSVPEKDGYTPMHGAGFQGRAEIARLLIAHGLDPSDRHGDGFTPLHRACWGREQRHADTVRAFLEAGVPLHEASSTGQTCRDLASGNIATLKMLDGWESTQSSRVRSDHEEL
ncbi:hypothetical protein CEUSTIGMA_g4351.t1 [Chlamydomonas eustigma]|uniref:Uncharacterized protein n=1 Tax=Chlamydomonas eustigma TaxID=1157962 RepID=A0A250X1G6_9CHLO|nr:hypothetical protein CEUSTIGMA_g4351.t1 [Chlamydomonas eustigma]|eukprot:GAX76905.1 hypothetical protein CEUSTIGMA_g4351.t1 [Chlamydomonas eustigma]